MAESDTPPLIDSMITAVIEAEARGRTVAAGLGLVNLRNLHPDERAWRVFVAKNFQFSFMRADELIGKVLHRGGVLRCTTCGQITVCMCGCGRSYAPEFPQAGSALDRAKAAIAAHPKRSNRRLAREIGVSFETVRRARKAL
jgi:hypothetical protein